MKLKTPENTETLQRETYCRTGYHRACSDSQICTNRRSADGQCIRHTSDSNSLHRPRTNRALKRVSFAPPFRNCTTGFYICGVQRRNLNASRKSRRHVVGTHYAKSEMQCGNLRENILSGVYASKDGLYFPPKKCHAQQLAGMVNDTPSNATICTGNYCCRQRDSRSHDCLSSVARKCALKSFRTELN